MNDVGAAIARLEEQMKQVVAALSDETRMRVWHAFINNGGGDLIDKKINSALDKKELTQAQAKLADLKSVQKQEKGLFIKFKWSIFTAFGAALAGAVAGFMFQQFVPFG